MLERKDVGIRPGKSESLTSPELLIRKTARKKNRKKKRFSDEQIKSLEAIFESESSKLEHWKKLQLARDLGLQPRQVSIWFQNRRARWKSKQLESNYSVLRANYDALASRFESLKKEHQSLLVQLQKLSGSSDNGDAKCAAETKPSLPLEAGSRGILSCPDDENHKVPGFFGQEGSDHNIVENPDGLWKTPENWKLGAYMKKLLIIQFTGPEHGQEPGRLNEGKADFSSARTYRIHGPAKSNCGWTPEILSQP
ncbi:hypothetical protein NE237_012197 [Protea cynaroides]|uniref:Homeobox-leucine zipper protein n=1 Tax=Protea cynaroides TaxID=273540 RepID=A0A9Q0JWL0_9MAGN|nr:hypothetical protein NE237_012197 [Protea cynaroides]